MIRAKFSPGCLAPGSMLWVVRGIVWQTKQQEVYKLNVAETENNWTEFNGLGHSKGNKKEMLIPNLTHFLHQEMFTSFLIDEGSVLRWGQVRAYKSRFPVGARDRTKACVCAMVQRCSQTIQRSSRRWGLSILSNLSRIQQRAYETCQQEMPTWKYWDWNWGRHKETIHLEMTFKTGERKTNDFDFLKSCSVLKYLLSMNDIN